MCALATLDGLSQMGHSQRIAQRALQASTNLKQAMVIARTASLASTGSPQDKQLERPVRSVSRTPTRLLRAVLVTPALATQGTVATPVTHTLHALRAQ